MRDAMERRMKLSTWPIAAAAAIVAITLNVAPAANAQSSRADVEAIVKDYLAQHPEDVQRIVKDYLVKNPEVLRDALAEMIKRRAPAAAVSTNSQKPDQTAAIQSNAKLLFDSTHQVVLGNPRGSVTMVEFFDYNCGYCKRALSDMLTLLKDDTDLRIVLKEFPVLGSASIEAARISIAVRMQDPAGGKYLAFHRRLLGDNGRADSSSALAVAREVGLDVTRLEQDLSSDEVRDTLAESAKLARAVSINGTPGYVIGNTIIPGAIGASGLKEKIALARNNSRK